ncbi:hypothetical protein [Candidatus Ichthyocystis hellenicum]|uniref:hypothetical protein n=1 Tax=Candidatus Ichthyocystis hellenicum TaxID=1561003 RepID=UPI000B8A182A|nr:hypothetical protein [Candidatus Ichthyocystis hellenicum]
MRSIFSMCFGNNGDDDSDGASSGRLSPSHVGTQDVIIVPLEGYNSDCLSASSFSALSVGIPSPLSDLSFDSSSVSKGECRPNLPLVSFLSGSLGNLSSTSCGNNVDGSLSRSLVGSGSICFSISSYTPPPPPTLPTVSTFVSVPALASIFAPVSAPTPPPPAPPPPPTLANIFALCCCNCNRSDS